MRFFKRRRTSTRSCSLSARTRLPRETRSLSRSAADLPARVAASQAGSRQLQSGREGPQRNPASCAPAASGWVMGYPKHAGDAWRAGRRWPRSFARTSWRRTPTRPTTRAAPSTRACGCSRTSSSSTLWRSSQSSSPAPTARSLSPPSRTCVTARLPHKNLSS